MREQLANLASFPPFSFAPAAVILLGWPYAGYSMLNGSIGKW